MFMVIMLNIEVASVYLVQVIIQSYSEILKNTFFNCGFTSNQ